MKLVDVYIHTASDKMFVYSHPGDKLVAIVYYSSLTENGESVAKQVALQVAAMNPDYLSLDTVPVDVKEKVKKDLEADVLASGKPADMVEKIVAGKFDKAFAENVLTEQSAIWDDSKRVKDACEGNITLTSFHRIAVGS